MEHGRKGIPGTSLKKAMRNGQLGAIQQQFRSWADEEHAFAMGRRQGWAEAQESAGMAAWVSGARRQ
eukprot:6298364-Karenia_brevis.AAC.1